MSYTSQMKRYAELNYIESCLTELNDAGCEAVPIPQVERILRDAPKVEVKRLHASRYFVNNMDIKSPGPPESAIKQEIQAVAYEIAQDLMRYVVLTQMEHAKYDETRFDFELLVAVPLLGRL